MSGAIPNLRLNALWLGVRLIAAAANPWSGLSAQASRKVAWQPVDPFGFPRWWPLGLNRSVELDQIELMRSVLPAENCPACPQSARPIGQRDRAQGARRFADSANARAAILAHTTALAEPGFVIVPKEPTEAMVKVAEECLFEHLPEARDWAVTMAREALRAAIDAALQPPPQKG